MTEDGPAPPSRSAGSTPDPTPVPFARERDRSGSFAGLPRDIQTQAVKRLGVASLVYSAAYVLAYGTGRIFGNTDLSGGPAWPGDVSSVVFILLGLGMYFLTRRPGPAPSRLLRWGLVFQVVAAAGIDIYVLWEPRMIEMPVTGISWVCVWIAVFPAIVPAPPRKALMAAMAAASMRPLLIAGAAVAEGVAWPPLAQWMAATIPGYICVGIAYVASVVVHGLGRSVARARELGSYHLERRLGQGGMGEVWLASHRLLKHPAAVKFVRPEALGGMDAAGRHELQRRFQREAHATARLTSVNTVKLHDFGITDSGVFYYAMEFLEGLDLDTMVKRFGPLPWPRAVHILRQACDSLGEAHLHGLVHRDVKPANIYLCRQGTVHDVVKVLDFGLVKGSRRSPADASGPNLTRENVAAGTPAYMAPEMVAGDRPVDGRSDIYALGCVAYWLLVGETVFPAESGMRSMVAHLTETPSAPSARAEEPIPPELDAVVLACLAKDPPARPGSAEELRRMLAVEGYQAWDREAADEWWHLHFPGPNEIERQTLTLA